MARRSDLSARVSAILDARQPRGPAGFLRAAAVMLCAAALVAGLAPLRVVAASIGVADSAEPAEQSRTPRRVRGLDRALVESVQEGDLEGVREILDAGGNVNAAVDGDGSPLIIAAREGELALVTFLLDRGADPNLAVEGDGNPLIMASQEGHVGIVTLLLDRGADIDAVVPGDENPLIQASAEGRLDVVRLLLSRGANIHARVWAESGFERRGEWRTPLSMARRGGHGTVGSGRIVPSAGVRPCRRATMTPLGNHLRLAEDLENRRAVGAGQVREFLLGGRRRQHLRESLCHRGLHFARQADEAGRVDHVAARVAHHARRELQLAKRSALGVARALCGESVGKAR
jgi:hypothetical protein